MDDSILFVMIIGAGLSLLFFCYVALAIASGAIMFYFPDTRAADFLEQIWLDPEPVNIKVGDCITPKNR